LLIFYLSNDAINSSDDTVSNNRINNEWERMWKEAVLAKFAVLFRNFPGEIDGFQ